jgi:hypothetical protein
VIPRWERRSRKARPYYETPLGIELARKGITAAELGDRSGASRADVSNYMHGHTNKVGRVSRARIRAALSELGIADPTPDTVPVCRNCGAEYPLGGSGEA